MSTSTVTLTGWGRIAPSAAELAAPASDAEAAALLRQPRAAGGAVIPRGLGRSYNNAAQSAGGLVLSTGRLNRIISLDPATGVAVCEAGVSLEQLMVAGLPAGWFVPVSPGTRQVTIGGAIAADVHGKNHHVAGSFARHVLSFDLLAPDGESRTVDTGRRAVLGDGRRHGPDRLHHPRHRAAQAGRDVAVQGGHGADRGHRRDDGGARRARQQVRLHGRMVRQPGQGPRPWPVDHHQRRLRRAQRPAGRSPQRPVRIRPAVQARRAARVPARPDQQVLGPARQRRVVPQGAPAARGGAADDRAVLPPLGRDKELEPGLRSRRLPPVPVRACRSAPSRPSAARSRWSARTPRRRS